MLKPIKIVHPEHDVWFVSDTHYHHDRPWIYEPRSFKDITSHDEELIHRWNSVCSPRSIVFNLGDFVFGDPDGARFKALCRRLSFGTMYHLWGNHFSGAMAVYKETLAARFPDAVVDSSLIYEVYPLEYHVDGDPAKKVVFCPTYIEASIGGQRFSLCHYALASHNKMVAGSISLTGHSHGNLPLTNKNTGTGMRLDVGIESFGRPISMTEVRRHLSGRSIDARDHHGKGESS